MAVPPALSPVPAPPPPAAGPPPVARPQVPVPPADFAGWAIMNLNTGAVSGSGNLAQTSTTASMIKAWLVADYLRLASEQGETPGDERMTELSLIIRDSHNGYTHTLWEEIGEQASIDRLIGICGLTDSRPDPSGWSNTRLSPRDTARMAACIARGRAAGDQWTSWLLEQMRGVRGLGDFGIRDAFTGGERAGIAIKNGWVIRSATGEYHVNCLAIGNGWSMGVMTRYPFELGYEHGAEICRALAVNHLP
jgi:hypothetical protein